MKITRIVVAALAVVLLAGCAKKEKEAGGAAGSGAPAIGDAIVQGSIGDVSGFLTAVTSDSASHTAAGYVFNGLVRYDKDL
ncbi:MAG: peptide-binding protein, partial [Deltaproteobacteria bacterium]|nr:peptide-binding protein [Deltaproteobacteria bacterium]